MDGEAIGGGTEEIALIGRCTTCCIIYFCTWGFGGVTIAPIPKKHRPF